MFRWHLISKVLVDQLLSTDKFCLGMVIDRHSTGAKIVGRCATKNQWHQYKKALPLSFQKKIIFVSLDLSIERVQ